MDLDTYNVIQKMGQLDPISSLLTILELFPLLLRDLMAVVQQILNLKNLSLSLSLIDWLDCCGRDQWI